MTAADRETVNEIRGCLVAEYQDAVSKVSEAEDRLHDCRTSMQLFLDTPVDTIRLDAVGGMFVTVKGQPVQLDLAAGNEIANLVHTIKDNALRAQRIADELKNQVNIDVRAWRLPTT